MKSLARSLLPGPGSVNPKGATLLSLPLEKMPATSKSSDPYRRAYRLWRSAHFSDAERVLLELPSSRRLERESLLLGRLVARRDASAGAAFFERDIRRLSGDSYRVEATILLAHSYAKIGDYRKADARFRNARSLINGDEPRALFAYYYGAASFYHGRIVDTSSISEAARHAKSPDTRIRCELLQGAILASREQYRQQIPHLLQALKIADADKTPSTELLAYTVENMAVLVRELYEPTLASVVEDRLQTIEWTDELSEQQFVVAKALGWWKALNGDYFNGFRLLKHASEASRDPAWTVLAKVDRAYLARCLREPRWSEQELLEARELSRGVNWKAEQSETTIALVLLAELYAPVDTSLAVEFLSRYRAVQHNLSPSFFGRHDRRLAALADYSSAMVEWKLGNRDDAIGTLQRVYDIYDVISYDWRAGRAALDLAKLTGNVMWSRRAQEKLAQYPRSWLTNSLSIPELKSSSKSPELKKLTPAQRRVYDLLIVGKSTEVMAHELGISHFTVRNHIKVLFSVFKDNSRPGLLAQVRNL